MYLQRTYIVVLEGSLILGDLDGSSRIGTIESDILELELNAWLAAPDDLKVVISDK